MSPKHLKQIKVIDLFAGPGGLGEGFTSYEVDGHYPFRIALSIEKDGLAHKTLELRSFYRQFAQGGVVPPEYWTHLQGKLEREALFAAHPGAAHRAREEAIQLELGEVNRGTVRGLLGERKLGSEDTIVIGGPPCQAYSLAGRSRNSAKAGWSLESDARSTLYLEYLQVLADVQPLAFVMENVRGLLSARMNGELVFDHIRRDLQNPRGELRYTRSGGRRYHLIPLAPRSTESPTRQLALMGDETSATDFLLRAEKFGVPQARHRVIVLGVREDVIRGSDLDVRLKKGGGHHTVRDAFARLPRLRGGISGGEDSHQHWISVLQGGARAAWFHEVPHGVRARMRTAIGLAEATDHTRGSEFLHKPRLHVPLHGAINHRTRGHMPADLHRYLFASAWAEEYGSSPTLKDFPDALLPDHSNVRAAMAGGMFADRFRVQVWDNASTTVVSHISKDGHYYIHPDPSQCRSLTVREAARLQTFPDDYLFCGPRTAQYHQVGNAVPVELARRIAAVVAEILSA